MKLARTLLNFLLFVVTFFIFLFSQYGVTALYTAQAGQDVERVHVSAGEYEVGYLDAPKFMVADLKVGYASEEFHSVRDWFDSEWWHKNMKWADVAISKVVVTFKGVFLPVADIDDLRVHHVEGYTEEWKEYYNWHYILESDSYKRYAGIDPALSREEIGILAANPEVENYEVYLDYLVALNDLTKDDETMNQNQWILKHNPEYSYIRKAFHFNTDEMQVYYNKFINTNGDIKFAAVSVYVQYMIALIASIWFVSNNKFKIKRDEETGENEVEGGFKLPGFRGKKAKKKHRK